MIPAAFVGRGRERTTIDRMLSEVRDGASRSLVIRGDPGIGKSALVDYTIASAAGFLVIRVTGIESEVEFAFAALQQACAPLLKHLHQLPGPQADALRVACGLRAAENPVVGRVEPPDRFLVGLGVLALELAGFPGLALAALPERDARALLPGAFGMAATASLLTGDLAAAASYVEQNDSARAVTRSIAAPHGRLALGAWRGQAGVGAPGDGTTGDDSDSLDRGGADRAASLGVSAYTTALLCNGLGRYQEAADAAETVIGRVDQLGYTLWALPELAEGAARCGKPALAASAVSLLERTTLPSGTEWGLGMLARCRALTRDGEQAEELYREAIARLGRTRVVPQLARARLLYGEWLRREKRRIDARAELRAAGEIFAAMGASGFARRADRELAATGEHVRKRDVRPVVDLTAQEEQIARLVADGQSNPEIAVQLFISPRTVEYHLHKIFAKLDITGRGQLARALPVR
jgi:DNA-binding CsgD family transcriptional regulator/tetratricopeptide (TPR) repeat protein